MSEALTNYSGRSRDYFGAISLELTAGRTRSLAGRFHGGESVANQRPSGGRGRFQSGPPAAENVSQW